MDRHRRPRYSLIIPARNEEAYLPRLLDTVDRARSVYRLGDDSVEVIVADNVSTDATARVARERGCRVATVEERRIASVRNGGARLAAGSLLAFVDADMRIHPDTFNAIDRCLATGRFVAGATGVKLERWSIGIAATYALMVPWVWLLRMDTGVVFCRTEDFRTIGGYDQRRYYGEDVQLLLDLRRVGRRRGQRLARVRSAKAVSSMRKWDVHGNWHFFPLVVKLLGPMIFSPRAAPDEALRYWYGDEHDSATTTLDSRASERSVTDGD